MKIVDFKRDATNAVVAILDDDSEKVLSSEYVAQNKPQIGDELIEDEPTQVEEVQSEQPKSEE